MFISRMEMQMPVVMGNGKQYLKLQNTHFVAKQMNEQKKHLKYVRAGGLMKPCCFVMGLTVVVTGVRLEGTQ